MALPVALNCNSIPESVTAYSLLLPAGCPGRVAALQTSMKLQPLCSFKLTGLAVSVRVLLADLLRVVLVAEMDQACNQRQA